MEPMLLDTCLVQRLKEVMDMICEDWRWRDGAPERLMQQYGDSYGRELVALGEIVQLTHYSGPPWIVSRTSLLEFLNARPDQRQPLLNWWSEWASYWEASAPGYPEFDAHALFDAGSQVSPDQLSLQLEVPRLSPIERPTFPPFKDRGDCALIRDALRSGVPSILTVDLRSFWRFRSHLEPLGIRVNRPSDVWASVRPRQQPTARVSWPADAMAR